MSELDRSAAVGVSRTPGVVVAALTAFVSGVSVFVNSYGVHSFSSPNVYTTAKNIVAAVILMALAALARLRRSPGMLKNFATVTPDDRETLGTTAVHLEGRSPWGRRWALAYVGVVGGGLAFALFFHGLAVASPTSAAFWRDTMVLWVAVGAVTLLGERIKWWNVAAIGLLVLGEIVVTGGVGPLATSNGELFVLGATVLWALEVIVVKSLLVGVAPATVSTVRMGVGSISLVAYLVASGAAGALTALTGSQIHWALWTGGLLALYVATWMTALARARALDVTSVLVGSAVVTWLLQLVAGTTTPVASSLGLILIVVGVVLVAGLSLKRLVDRTRSTVA